ncbi:MULTISPECIES: 4-hydroxy-tetrahydrodipicolinate reductase [unclassified Clostridium]|uniref:4-hydroxy-tetrahydrodipicolinate reductase n=1 Tax=unclassified Clostridium TaxID=2614128 RepID=UPI000297510A|nr:MULTISPECIES: 4-hydroxy-tetrahydrodipicolinate reductase [unclassified Clostridium]EKQ56051.1 MAG: dihydrodipicolinate reductase [Clostridium sp. Maddingley MBC34-26]
MLKISVVGCTGKLGSVIAKKIYSLEDLQLVNAIGRKGNRYIGQDISSIIGGQERGLKIGDSIVNADVCDVFIDCTNAENLLNNNYEQYLSIKKPLVIATTGFDTVGMERTKELSKYIPVMQSGNFSIAFHDFIETLKFAVSRISNDTDVSIIELHHNQKKDAPSGTAIMIQEALVNSNTRLNFDNVSISSIRGGTIVGEHKVIFANCSDEIVEYRHQISSRKALANGAIEVSKWLSKQPKGFYNMDDFCNQRKNC